MVRNYFKIAIRHLNRHKLFTAINVLGLATGFCACLIIYLVSTYELSFDVFHPDKERIYRVSSKEIDNDFNDGDVPAPVPAALATQVAGIESVAGYFPYYNPTIVIPDPGKTAKKFENNQKAAIIAGQEYFSVFKYEWLAGNPLTALNQPFKVVLSERKAHKYFGDIPLTSMIGKEIIYDDSLRLTLSGIVKDWTGNSDFPYDEFISFNTIQSSFLKNTRHMTDWRLMKGMGQYYWPVCFIKLSKGTAVATINKQLQALVDEHIEKESAKRFSMFLQPLTDIHFNNTYSHDDIRKAHLPTLYALMAIALFILVIAAINFINLSTAQSIQRAKEIGVRKVLGSNRLSLIFQFLTETLLLCLTAAIVALLFAGPVIDLFRDFIPGGVRLNNLNTPAVVFLFGISIATSLLAGFYPARMISSFLPVLSLKGAAPRKGSEKWLLRKGLIVFQFSISLFFIIGTLVVGGQIRYMLHSDFGLKTDAILNLDNWSWKDDIHKTEILRQKLMQLPGVQKAIVESGAPMGWGIWTTSVHYKAKEEISLDVTSNAGNEDFISFYGIKLIAGRNISHSDSLTEFLINETCAKALGFTNPQMATGKILYFNSKPIPIVGVVADFHQGSFRDAIKPLIIGHQPLEERSVAIKLSTKGNDAEDVKSILAGVEKVWKNIYPGKQFGYSFMDESIATFYEKEQKTMKLSQAAMYVTIFISCMGLFGLSMFTSEKRAKEIGIRKVLGAGVADIVLLLTRDFLVLVIIALVIASPLASIFMHSWLQDFAFRINISAWIFVLAGLSAILIAMITVSFQAFKAAISNPVKSLRTE